ncbi:hypothetical protein KQX54_000231, partial [Cotesia glomerata]
EKLYLSYSRTFLSSNSFVLMILKESELTDLEKEAAERILSSDVDSTLEGMKKEAKTSKTLDSICSHDISSFVHCYMQTDLPTGIFIYLDMLNLKTKMKINSEKLYNSELNRLQVENNNYSNLCESCRGRNKNYYNDYLGRNVVDLYHDNLTDLKTRYQESSMEFEEEKEKLQSRFGDSLDRKKHPPFLELAQVINIGTGIVGGPDVNCFDAQRIGEESYNQMLLNSTSFDNLAVSRSKVI